MVTVSVVRWGGGGVGGGGDVLTHHIVSTFRPHSDQIDLLLNLLYGGRERRAIT